jgi:hypothetical protein
MDAIKDAFNRQVVHIYEHARAGFGAGAKPS